ncbi:MAG: MFS transporter [Candidatus Spyradocola sp.]
MKQKRPSIWTRDFAILTAGSLVSMAGNNISSLAISMLVLDHTQSVLAFGLFQVVYNLPRLVMPLLAGPMLDRRSRRSTIYALDFFSAGFYLLAALLVAGDLITYPVLLAMALLIGTTDSVYAVAYDSFFPTLVAPESLSRAYSVSGLLGALTTVLLPVSAWAYERVGLTPLFLFNAATFLVAAVCETRIRACETHVAPATASRRSQLRRYSSGLREGMRFISAEKGLLILIVFLALSELCHNVMNTVTLPWFKSPEGLGVQAYTWVGVFCVAGRLAGSAGNYLARVPERLKAPLLAALNAAVCVCFAAYLFLPLPGMLALAFTGSVAGVMAYAQRSSGVQSYVPDAVRARFNSVGSVAASLGAILGQLLGGALGDCLPMRAVAAGSMLALLVCTMLTLGAGWRRIAVIFNKTGDA